MRQITVDRFEDDLAVCEENGNMLTVNVSDLPENAVEGSILIMTENGWKIDEKATEDRRNMLFNLQNSLFDE